MVEINELKEQIKAVALARQCLVVAQNSKREAMAKWEVENAELLDRVRYFTETKDEQELRLRTMVEDIYCETGNKKPAPGVGIREVTRLDYDPKQAFDYAKEHGVALKLDVSAFEKMAKISELRPFFVTVTTEPQATIATELPIEEGK